MSRGAAWRFLAIVGAIGSGGTPAALAQAMPSIRDLSFMAGCWEGEFRTRDGSTGVIEEHYTSPSDNVMLGTTRYLLNDATTQFELTAIRQRDSRIVLFPYPGGRASADGFVLTRSGEGFATFEAPEHDFPKRIVYRADGGDGLVARIDDGTDDGQATEWRLTRRSCPGS